VRNEADKHRYNFSKAEVSEAGGLSYVSFLIPFWMNLVLLVGIVGIAKVGIASSFHFLCSLEMVGIVCHHN
jgi:hypothetical protein